MFRPRTVTFLKYPYSIFQSDVRFVISFQKCPAVNMLSPVRIDLHVATSELSVQYSIDQIIKLTLVNVPTALWIWMISLESVGYNDIGILKVTDLKAALVVECWTDNQEVLDQIPLVVNCFPVRNINIANFILSLKNLIISTNIVL